MDGATSFKLSRREFVREGREEGKYKVNLTTATGERRKMKDIKQEVDKFLENFQNASEIENLRNAIVVSIGQEGKIDLENLEKVEKILNEWFKERLYSLGRIIEEFKIIFKKDDWDNTIGIGYSVEAKKDKINIGRYLLHLLLIIECKNRQIENLQKEVQAGKETYLDMEEIISVLINDETIPEDIKDRFSKFYWLKEYKE